MTDTARNLVRVRVQALVVTLCVMGLAYLAQDALGQAWVQARRIALARDSGWLALLFLLCALSATPVGRLLGRFLGGAGAAVAHARRALGIASAWLALLHAALGFLGLLQASASVLVSWPHLRAGLLALCVLLALLLTSFPALVRTLRLRGWKELHRLAHVAALLALQHVLLSPFAPRVSVLWWFAGAGVLGLLRLVPPGRPDQTRPAIPDSRQKRSSTPL